jgi:uncharacterized damage-inducible protein DinB
MARKNPDGSLGILLSLLDEAFDRRSWHGTNLRGSLRGLSAAEAARRPAPERHNVWEIAVHAAYWKYAVWRRLTGEKRGSFGFAGSNWWRRPEAEPTEEAWRADVERLVTRHVQLRAVVARLKPADLGRPAPGGRPVTVGGLVRGIAAHDLYHAGQIQLLKRLRQASR